MSNELSNPQAIAEEYLQAGKPSLQHRNALTLLRVLGGSENAVRIAHEATANPDAEVRQSALRELFELKVEDRSMAAEELRRVVDALPSVSEALRAYTALAKMGEQPSPSTGFWWKIRAEFLVYQEVQTERGFALFTRTLGAAEISAAAASVLILAYLVSLGLLLGVGPTMQPVLIILALFSVAVAAPLLTLRSVAFHRHFHPLRGLLAECSWPVPFLFVLYALGYLVSAFFPQKSNPDDQTPFWSFVFPFLVLAAAALACRLGTIIWLGRNPSGRTGFFIRTMLGASLATIALTTLLWLRPTSALANLWPTLVPVYFGLAAAFAKIDSPDKSISRSGTVWRAALAALSCLGFVVLLWLPFRNQKQMVVELAPNKVETIPLIQLPETLHFVTKDKAGIYFTLSDPAVSDDTKLGNQNSNLQNLDAGLAIGQTFLIPSANKASAPQSGSAGLQGFVPQSALSPPQSYTAPRGLSKPGTFAQDVARGKYSISVWDGQHPPDGTQAGIFYQLFAAQAHRETLPKVNAELMLAGWGDRPSFKPEVADQTTIPIPYVPYAFSMNVKPDAPILHVNLQDQRMFGTLYALSIHRKGDDKPLSIFINSLKKVAPGEYHFLVSRRASQPAPQGAPDETGKQVQFTAPGVAVDVSSFGITKESLGKPGTTVIPANGNFGCEIEVPGLPFVHFVKMDGQARRIMFRFNDNRPDTSMMLYDANGNTVAQDSAGDLGFQPTLNPGRYYLIIFRGSLEDVPTTVVNGRVPIATQQRLSGSTIDIY